MAEELDAADRPVSGTAYRVLLQVAMLGAELGEFAYSIEIAETLDGLRPDLPHAGIALAMSDFGAGRKDEGIRGLEGMLTRFPDSQLATAMLAVCLQATGRGGWQEMLESVIEDGRDEYAIGLACAILGRSGGASSGLPTASVPAHALWA